MSHAEGSPMFRSLCLVAWFASVALAQTASITGRVTDPAGAVVPGVTITAKSVESGVSTGTLTNQDGYYSLTALPPGVYDLTVTKAGFGAITEQHLALEVQQV